MNPLEHVPKLAAPYKWIRNHSRRQFEIWINNDLLKASGKPLAVITDDVLSRSKKSLDEALESFVFRLMKEGKLSD